VRRAFGLIASGTSDLRGRTGEARLRVSLLPSFAANWLVPRLARFTEAHPEIDLVLDPTLRLADLNAGDADLAIRYGDGRWDGVDSRLLMAERLTPVASPALLAKGPKIAGPSDLLKYPLLVALHPYEWEAWAEAVGLDLTGVKMIQLTDFNIIVQAAIEGQGIAIARLLLISDRLRSGALVQPCAQIVTSPRVGHWLVTGKRASLSAAAQTFVDWLVHETAATARTPAAAHPL
jgi:LysR family glycine cleavage system transcriptional activator